MSFQCERCKRTGRYPSWVTARYHENTAHRCPYCGTTHCVRIGHAASAITPPFVPDGSRLSPWIDAKFRPYVAGSYECEFRDGLRLHLQWNGRAWTYTGLVVDMSNHYKWRGKYA